MIGKTRLRTRLRRSTCSPSPGQVLILCVDVTVYASVSRKGFFLETLEGLVLCSVLERMEESVKGIGVGSAHTIVHVVLHVVRIYRPSLNTTYWVLYMYVLCAASLSTTCRTGSGTVGREIECMRYVDMYQYEINIGCAMWAYNHPRYRVTEH